MSFLYIQGHSSTSVSLVNIPVICDPPVVHNLLLDSCLPPSTQVYSRRHYPQ